MKTNPAALLCALLAGAVLLAACRSGGTSSSVREDDSYRTLLYGYQSGLEPGTALVARDEAEWQKLWSEHTSHMMPRPPAPSVDWEKDMVVCIALGERPTAGYGIVIEHIEVEGGRVIVDAVERKPAKDSIQPQVITHPYVIATTPRASGEVELRLR